MCCFYLLEIAVHTDCKRFIPYVYNQVKKVKPNEIELTEVQNVYCVLKNVVKNVCE